MVCRERLACVAGEELRFHENADWLVVERRERNPSVREPTSVAPRAPRQRTACRDGQQSQVTPDDSCPHRAGPLVEGRAVSNRQAREKTGNIDGECFLERARVTRL